MNYRRLGRSGLKISSLPLGTLNFGNPAPKEEAFKMIDRAIDLPTHPAWRIVEALWISDRYHYPKLVCEQSPYHRDERNLIRRERGDG